MSVRILAGRVQLVVVMRVLNRTNSVTAGGQLLDEINDQRRLAAVLSTNDVNAVQNGSL